MIIIIIITTTTPPPTTTTTTTNHNDNHQQVLWGKKKKKNMTEMAHALNLWITQPRTWMQTAQIQTWMRHVPFTSSKQTTQMQTCMRTTQISNIQSMAQSAHKLRRTNTNFKITQTSRCRYTNLNIQTFALSVYNLQHANTNSIQTFEQTLFVLFVVLSGANLPAASEAKIIPHKGSTVP